MINCRDNLEFYLPDSAKKVTRCVRYLVRNHDGGIEEKGDVLMAKTKGVSSKTHTKKQCDDYANQHNPNNKAYWANRQNKKAMSKKPGKSFPRGDYFPVEWLCYCSNPFDFE